MKSCSKCLKLEAHEMAKKPLLSLLSITPSWSQICKEVFKSLVVEGGRDYYLFWMGPIYIFLAA